VKVIDKIYVCIRMSTYLFSEMVNYTTVHNYQASYWIETKVLKRKNVQFRLYKGNLRFEGVFAVFAESGALKRGNTK
jgi:hypothetical protein